MKYTSLYRKYRPQVFEDIVEQDYIVKILRNQVINKSIAHAYLFTGTRGTGKTTIARIFARSINCESPQNGSPCLKCSTCLALNEVNTDIFELDAASNNGVDDIRDIRDSVQYPPLMTKYKVYIIDEVHQLTSQAFNAFLKTLEEPPEYCVFILATTEPDKLPQTILSRCLKLDFRLVSIDGLAARLKSILDEEGVQYTEEAINSIATAGEGSVRDSLSILEACISASSGKIDYELVLDVLGSNNPDFVANLCEAIIGGDINYALSLVQFASSRGKNIPVLVKDIIKYLRDLLIIKSNDKAQEFLKLPENIYNRSKSIADKFGVNEILNCLDIFSSIDMQVKYSTTPRFLLETAIAKCSSTNPSNLLNLSKRVDSVERKIENGISITKVVKEVEVRVQNTGEVPASNNLQEVQDISSMQQTENLPFDIDEPKSILDEPEEKLVQSEIPKEVKDNKPNQKTINKAKAVKLKNALLQYFQENKIHVCYDILTEKDNYILVYNEVVEIVVRSKFDADILQIQVKNIKELTDKLLNGNYNVIIKVTEGKLDESDFKGEFSTSKIIVKK